MKFCLCLLSDRNVLPDGPGGMQYLESNPEFPVCWVSSPQPTHISFLRYIVCWEHRVLLENYQSLVHFCQLGFDNGVVCLSRELALLGCVWWAHWRDLGRGLGISWVSWVELDTDRLTARELNALDLLKFLCGHGSGRGPETSVQVELKVQARSKERPEVEPKPRQVMDGLSGLRLCPSTIREAESVNHTVSSPP